MGSFKGQGLEMVVPMKRDYLCQSDGLGVFDVHFGAND